MLIAPLADGTNDIATLFDSGPQRHAAARLKLISCKPVAGGVVWLRYKVLKKG